MFGSHRRGDNEGLSSQLRPLSFNPGDNMVSSSCCTIFSEYQFERTIRFMLATGQPFPSFSLPNQDGKTTTLSDFAGHWLVVYFYPKDDTPGCTIQGKSFTASKADFDAAGIKIVGISADDAASHKNFCNKFSFNVDLLADTSSALMKNLGI